ncbi:MaoC/PaaZ C-terminal domain-containing protein [Chloroflexota bacterium]
MDSKQLFFEDVSVGDEISPITKKATLVQNVMYAAATWDFHRHHYDKEFTDSKGYLGTFIDGQLFGAFLAQLVAQWAGADGVVKKLGLSYRVMAIPGDVLTCKGRVADKYDKDSENLVHCDLWIENQRGEKVVGPAHALLALPLRNSKA